MVKKICIVLGVSLMLTAATALAQDSKAEVFAGYQLTHFNVGGGLPGINFNGWDAAVNVNVSPMWAITGDVSGAYKDGAKDHFFMFGPTVRYNSDRGLAPFAHGLFGADHASGGGFSDNSMALGLGGGLDLRAGSRFSLRLGQFDYLMTHFGGQRQNNFRYSAGIVFRFE